MQRFGYAGATVTTPSGDVHTKARAVLKDGVLTLALTGGEVLSIRATSSYLERKTWHVTDESGQTWRVRREGGCGCR